MKTTIITDEMIEEKREKVKALDATMDEKKAELTQIANQKADLSKEIICDKETQFEQQYGKIEKQQLKSGKTIFYKGYDIQISVTSTFDNICRKITCSHNPYCYDYSIKVYKNGVQFKTGNFEDLYCVNFYRQGFSRFLRSIKNSIDNNDIAPIAKKTSLLERMKNKFFGKTTE